MKSEIIFFIGTFAMALTAGPILIPLLRRLKFGQTVRDDGPATHFKKTGTPTMGGLIFLIPILISSVYFGTTYPEIIPLVFVTLGFGIIGFIDDLIKIIKKRKDGLYAGQKLFGLILISGIFAVYVYFSGLVTDISIPLAGMDISFNRIWIFIFYMVFVLIAETNAVNITDGLDGLAAGVTFFTLFFFVIISMNSGDMEHIKVFCAIVAGGCLGFLAFNLHPARVFMGDTGSLALGGAIGASAIMMKLPPAIIVVMGGVYVIEALSVIIQVVSFKLRGKRIFKMAPLHHHFELTGWKETKVVRMFWLISILLSILGIFMLKNKIF